MANEERRLNRTERLFALVLLLQSRPSLSSRNLAEHFGVSRRTIFRDLRALSESGVPLTYADEGGYEILEGYQLPPLMVTAREAATLLTGVEFMKLQSDASLRNQADSVGMKIRAVLPREVRDYIETLRRRTVLDPYWLHAVQEMDEREGGWYQLSEAVAGQRSVIMRYYVESRGESTRRQVDPLGLVYYTDHWNLVAFDRLRHDVRNFRLDRIEELHVLTERFTPPPGFELAAFLERNVGPVDSRLIKIAFMSSIFPRARTSIPARIVDEVTSGSETVVRFYFDNMGYLAKWLMRFGADVRVLEPDDLTIRHKAEASLIHKRYET